MITSATAGRLRAAVLLTAATLLVVVMTPAAADAAVVGPLDGGPTDAATAQMFPLPLDAPVDVAVSDLLSGSTLRGTVTSAASTCNIRTSGSAGYRSSETRGQTFEWAEITGKSECPSTVVKEVITEVFIRHFPTPGGAAFDTGRDRDRGTTVASSAVRLVDRRESSTFPPSRKGTDRG